MCGENSECGSVHEYGDKCSVCVNMFEGERKSCVCVRMGKVLCREGVCEWKDGSCVCVCMAHMYEVGMGCWLQQSPDAGPGG